MRQPTLLAVALALALALAVGSPVTLAQLFRSPCSKTDGSAQTVGANCVRLYAEQQQQLCGCIKVACALCEQRHKVSYVVTC